MTDAPALEPADAAELTPAIEPKATRRKARPPLPPDTTAWRSRIVGRGEEDPNQLRANPRNWRTHPKFQADAMAGVLDEIGWVQDVVLNQRTGNLVDGHLRVELAVARHETSVPVLYVDLDEAEEALVLATLDPLSAIAKTDGAKLRELLGSVEPESRDVRALLADMARAIGMDEVKEGLIGEDELAPEREEIYVNVGELWLLGEHRLYIGDSTNADDVQALLDDAEIDMVWTDPPYGVNYQAKLSVEEAIARRRRTDGLEISSDSPDNLEALLDSSLGLAVDALRPGGALYLCSPGGEMSFMFADALRRLDVYRQTIVWVKDVFVMGRQDYQWRHELVQLGVKPDRGTKAAGRLMYGWRPGAAHYFVPERDLDTVWEIPRPRVSAEHPTMKPVELVRRSISYSSRRGESVYDPFVGSGTTIIAAEEIGRRAYAMEIDPLYAQRAIERWQAFTGTEARRG